MAENISEQLSEDRGVVSFPETTPSAFNCVFPQDVDPQVTADESGKHRQIEDRLGQKIVCQYYDALRDDFLSFEGVIISINEDGLSFLARKPLEEEMPVLVRPESPLNNWHNDELVEGKHAQVITCRRDKSRGANSRYCIELEFF